jgi:hypothetical protein
VRSQTQRAKIAVNSRFAAKIGLRPHLGSAHARLRLVSPSALLEIEETAQKLVPVDLVRKITDEIWALDVADWEDEDFAALEGVIDRLVAYLTTPPIDPEHKPLIAKLLEARSGVEQGVAPNPEKRPTREQMRAFVAAHL